MARKPTITTKHAQLLVALADFGIEYIVEAGKYDGDGENCKYCNSFATYDEALAALDKVSDYPWSRIEVRHPELSRLRMDKALREHDAEMHAHAVNVAVAPCPTAFTSYYDYVGACRAHAKRMGQRVATYKSRAQFDEVRNVTAH